MKTATLKTLRLAIFTSVCAAALTLQPAFADDKMPPAPGQAKPEHCPMMEHGDHAAHVQRKLDELGQKLHLKDNQQSAWKDYRNYVTELSTEHAKMKDAHGDMHEKMSNLPAPERLQKAADKMRMGADTLDKLAKRTATFYKTLGPEQQTIFDLYSHQMHRGMHMAHKGM